MSLTPFSPFPVFFGAIVVVVVIAVVVVIVVVNIVILVIVIEGDGPWTMGQYSLMLGHLIIHFHTCWGVSEPANQ